MPRWRPRMGGGAIRREGPTPDLPHVSGIVPDAVTTHFCHSFLAFDFPSRESEAKARCSLLFLLLLELCALRSPTKSKSDVYQSLSAKFLFKQKFVAAVRGKSNLLNRLRR